MRNKVINYLLISVMFAFLVLGSTLLSSFVAVTTKFTLAKSILLITSFAVNDSGVL